MRFPSEINGRPAEDVAVKVLKAGAGPQAQEDLLREAEIMRSFHHRNILSLRGIVVNGTFNPTTRFYQLLFTNVIGLILLIRVENWHLDGRRVHGVGRFSSTSSRQQWQPFRQT